MLYNINHFVIGLRLQDVVGTNPWMGEVDNVWNRLSRATQEAKAETRQPENNCDNWITHTIPNQW